jgi:hypothetical protein
MRGLDPHPSIFKILAKRMDCRVKTGNDVWSGPGSAEQREERCAASGSAACITRLDH